MADFPVFPTANRDPEIEYASQSTTVSANQVDEKIQFEFVDIDLITEPSTTIFEWRIERRPNASAEWAHWRSGFAEGRDGVPFPKPVGLYTMRIPETMRNQHVRGVISFSSLNNSKVRWGMVARYL